MTLPITSATITRLEKAAVDNGFRPPSPAPERLDWVRQHPSTTQALADRHRRCVVPLRRVPAERRPCARRSRVRLCQPTTRGRYRRPQRDGHSGLCHLVRRAFQLSKTLPNELLHEFEKQTATLPRATEAERLVVQRLGQDVFRGGLLNYWEGRCAVTALAVTDLLRASHIKPWAMCATDAERLDVFNGLLLAPHLDAAFDRGYITVADDGVVVVSNLCDRFRLRGPWSDRPDSRHSPGRWPPSVSAVAPGEGVQDAPTRLGRLGQTIRRLRRVVV